MSPYYADDSVTLWHGDALAVLRELPDESVDCCVTSPPYYGLRDYGTASWNGGREGCDHMQSTVPRTPDDPGIRRSTLGGGKRTTSAQAEAKSYRGHCGRCGAIREDLQYGLEASPAEYVETMCAVFAEVRRVLAKDGTLWLNLGDSYANDAKWGGSSGGKHVEALHGPTGIGRGRKTTALPPKSLMGMPWRVAFALQEDGWILRNAVVWDKPNAMPESVTDRLSTTYELVFLLAKLPRYHFDLDAIREPYSENKPWGTPANGVKAAEAIAKLRGSRPGQQQNGLNRPLHEREQQAGRNPGDVWPIPTHPFAAAHFAVMPPALAERCVKAGCKPNGVVLDPFCGSGTTGMVAAKLGHRFVGIDLSPIYLDLALRTRLAQSALISPTS